MTLKCSDKCLFNFREDDLSRSDTACLVSCYNKQFRYIAYANKVYTMIMNSDKFGQSEGEGGIDDEDDEEHLAQRMS